MIMIKDRLITSAWPHRKLNEYITTHADEKIIKYKIEIFIVTIIILS